MAAYFDLNITDEFSTLNTVVLGIAEDMGHPLDINPLSKAHMEQGTYPSEQDIQVELASFLKALEASGVTVLRPHNLKGVEQIFTRDIGFVIDDKFVLGKMKEPVRQLELPGISEIINRVDPSKLLTPPDGATVEGGDVIVLKDHIVVGLSSRTNQAGIDFLKKAFPNRKVHAIPLVTGKDPDTHILHLDCAFQPLGNGYALIYEQGFREKPQIIYDLFEEEKLIKVSLKQKKLMFPNILSVGPNQVIVEENFHELIKELESKGFETLKVKFRETSKLSGLLRCATLPLRRTSA